MSSSTWQEFFKDRLQGLEAPLEGSFLEVALSENRFSEVEYLQWASQTLLVPVLDGSFFTEHGADPTLLKQTAIQWSSSLIPVASWDGALVVAGLERPENLPPEVVFVLAAPSLMAHWWESLKTETSLEPILENPEGMGTDKPLAGLSFVGISLAKPDSQAVREQNPTIEPVLKTSSQEPKTDVEPFSEDATQIGIKEPAAALLTQVQPLTPSAVAKTAEKFVVFTNSANEQHVLSDFATEHVTFPEDIKNALFSMSGQFSKVMFLAANEQGTALVPHSWSESFGKPQAAGRIPLTTPSPFRIAVMTEKPYHGFVVPNEITDMFSKSWNAGKLPDHLTIVPVFFQNRVIGALLGIGPAGRTPLQVLKNMEKISTDLTHKIGGDTEAAAA